MNFQRITYFIKMRKNDTLLFLKNKHFVNKKTY